MIGLESDLDCYKNLVNDLKEISKQVIFGKN